MAPYLVSCTGRNLNGEAGDAKHGPPLLAIRDQADTKAWIDCRRSQRDGASVVKTRRQFLDLILGTAIAGTVGSIVYPILRYLKPLPASGPTGPVQLTSADVEKLRQAKFVIVPVAGKRVIVLRDGSGELRAFDARCTHEGCTVQFLSRESAIWCACHNARFNLDGNVLSGPPPRPLPAYTVRESEDGAVMLGSDET